MNISKMFSVAVVAAMLACSALGQDKGLNNSTGVINDAGLENPAPQEQAEESSVRAASYESTQTRAIRGRQGLRGPQGKPGPRGPAGNSVNSTRLWRDLFKSGDGKPNPNIASMGDIIAHDKQNKAYADKRVGELRAAKLISVGYTNTDGGGSANQPAHQESAGTPASPEENTGMSTWELLFIVAAGLFVGWLATYLIRGPMPMWQRTVPADLVQTAVVIEERSAHGDSRKIVPADVWARVKEAKADSRAEVAHYGFLAAEARRKEREARLASSLAILAPTQTASGLIYVTEQPVGATAHTASGVVAKKSTKKVGATPVTDLDV